LQFTGLRYLTTLLTVAPSRSSQNKNLNHNAQEKNHVNYAAA
jgi:hypothetical protein